MEFLFTDKGASIEALIVLICLGVILLFFAHKGFLFLRRFFSVFIKRRPAIGITQTETSSTSEVAGVTLQAPAKDETTSASSSGTEKQDTTSVTQESGENISNEEKAGVTVDEEKIYADYVALVDETHAEKEKLTEESTEGTQSNDDGTVEQKVNEVISIANPQTTSNHTDEDSAQIDFDTVATESEHNENLSGLNNEEIQESTTIDSIDEIKSEVVDSVEEDVKKEEQVPEGEPEGEKDSGDTTVPDTFAEEVAHSEEEKENINHEEPLSEVKDESTSTTQSKEEEIESRPLPTNGEENQKQASNTNPPPKNHSETLFALINTIRTVIARGQLIEARALIIQGLSLDKGNRELNLMLGSLYEGDRHFEKAEYVYKDLAIDYPNDIEILEKLGNVLIIEKRYAIAMEIYKKILSLGGETEGTLYILSHLCHELGDASEGHLYMKKYLKSWPNNPEILALMSEVEIELGKRKDAIETLKRLKNLTPYNSEIAAMLQKLIMEEELAGNFGDNNS